MNLPFVMNELADVSHIVVPAPVYRVISKVDAPRPRTEDFRRVADVS